MVDTSEEHQFIILKLVFKYIHCADVPRDRYDNTFSIRDSLRDNYRLNFRNEDSGYYSFAIQSLRMLIKKERHKNNDKREIHDS